MAERAYTVTEIDALRQVLKNKMFGQRWVTCFSSDAQEQEDRRVAREAAMVEDVVRTHMLAGHTAEDIILAAKAA